MIPKTIEGIRVRIDANDGVELSAEDLARSSDAQLRSLALSDAAGDARTRSSGNKNGWVSEAELLRTTGLNPPASDAFERISRQVRTAKYPQVARLVSKRAPKKPPTPPKPLKAGPTPFGDRPRSVFIPLAEYLSARFVGAQHYQASTDVAGALVHHFNGDDLVRRYSMHELQAALAILTMREGGALEFGLSKDKEGHHHVILGLPDKVELDVNKVGFDLLFHTHPKSGPVHAQPSAGDLFSAREYDPNHRAAAVSRDGWLVEYRTTPSGQTLTLPTRLWKEV